MKYYRLKKDLPTFKKGELFYINEYGGLSRAKNNMVVYMASTIAEFPDILEDWFEEEPARDVKTKAAFEAYMTLHPEERFFQVIMNFIRRYLNLKGTGVNGNFLLVSSFPPSDNEYDTFFLECDEMLKEDGIDEEQRADEY